MHMRDLLNNIKKGKKVASIFTDMDNTDKCSTGFIGNVSDDFVVIKHISPSGKYDGFLLKSMEKIYRVDFNGEYENRVQYLYRLQNQNHKEIAEKYSSLILDIIDFAEKNSVVISLELYNSGHDDIQGYIKDVDNERLEIRRLDDSGKEDGISMVNISDITYISCDTENEIVLDLLFKSKI